MYLKKLISGIIFLAAGFLLLATGFQQVATSNVHVMEGKLMATHEMPTQGCSQKNCFIKIENTLLYAVFLKPFVKEISLSAGFISAFAGLTFVAISQRKLLSQNLLNFNLGAQTIENVVFRE